MVRGFVRFARKNRIDDATLVAAIDRANLGIVDADLGGGLVKLRVARPNEGRSGGYRTIVAYRREDRAFFLLGYAKNDRENVAPSEAAALREAGRLLLGHGEDALAVLTEEGSVIEIGGEE